MQKSKIPKSCVNIPFGTGSTRGGLALLLPPLLGAEALGEAGGRLDLLLGGLEFGCLFALVGGLADAAAEGVPAYPAVAPALVDVPKRHVAPSPGTASAAVVVPVRAELPLAERVAEPVLSLDVLREDERFHLRVLGVLGVFVALWDGVDAVEVQQEGVLVEEVAVGL